MNRLFLKCLVVFLGLIVIFLLWIFLWASRVDEIYFNISPSDGAKSCSYKIGDIRFPETIGFFYFETGEEIISWPNSPNRMGTSIGIWQWNKKTDVVIPILSETDDHLIKLFALTPKMRDTGAEPWPINLSFYGECNRH